MYIIIGGGGDVGYNLTKNLLNHGHEVLLLEKGAARYQTLSEELGPAVLRGDACEARTMEEVGASRADVMIAVTGDDEDNLVICQVAKKRYKVNRTIARLNNPKHADIFYKLGIDVTVSPTKSILSLIESEIPSSRFVQLMTLKSAGLEIVELRVPDESPLSRKPLRDINLSRSSNIVLLLRDRQPVFPSGETQIQAGDDIYALVTREGEEELRKAFGVVE